MEATEIINRVMINKTPYQRTMYLLSNYIDLKNGVEINGESRNVLDLLERAFKMVENDENFNIIRLRYIEGHKEEEIADILPADIKTVYKRRRKIIKRLAIIIYGDLAL